MMTDSEDKLNTSLKQLLDRLIENDNISFQEESTVLSEFRVLTREKTLKPDLLDEKCLNLLVNLSAKGHTEAQKSLSNLILNYAHIREQLVDPYVNCVKTRLSAVLQDSISREVNNSEHLTKEQVYETLYYDLRIVFLLSALCSATRHNIRDHLLDLILRLIIREVEDLCTEKYSLIIESLKTLFNLTIEDCTDKQHAKEVIKKLFAIIGTEAKSSSKCEDDKESGQQDQLLVNLIHLLTNMPEDIYTELSHEDADKVLRHLDEQLKNFSTQNFRDTVLPVLNVCANICNYKEDIRKTWFEEIIGSTRDFNKRPEEYDTLRGRLVKLMTSVDVHLKDIAAEFILALCGGDTDKFITYTGFGNSAAYLSTRGLLAKCSNKIKEGDAEAERDPEYEELREKLDPITGKLEGIKINPMEGMSEEQKEWHAHELANAITKLSNLGVVKPMGIDEEGQVSDLHPHGEKRDKID